MNKNYTVFILTGLVVLALGLFLWRSSRLQTISNTYEQVVALTPAHVSYRTAGLPLSGNGLLLYKVQLKELPFPHTLDKMSIKIDGNEVQIGLIGLSFDVGAALRGIYGDDLPQELKSYIPYQSVFTRPLESVALAGIERVKLNAKFTIKNMGISRQIEGGVQDRKIGKASFLLSLSEAGGLISIDSLIKSPLSSGEFSFEDIAFEEPYRAYAKSIGFAAPAQGLNHVRVTMPPKDELHQESVNQE